MPRCGQKEVATILRNRRRERVALILLPQGSSFVATHGLWALNPVGIPVWCFAWVRAGFLSCGSLRRFDHVIAELQFRVAALKPGSLVRLSATRKKTRFWIVELSQWSGAT
ncbi:MAG: hypothetical protein JWN25_602 [Verrucomicrobiales bacterium]|jgi:hypothetical protein|nr:hypothetical protein [Verrucomicrobiales bacterium]